MSLTSHLALLCLALLVPVLLLSAGLAERYITTERQTLEYEAVERVKIIQKQIEWNLAGQAAALQLLATSPALDHPDLAGFAQQAHTASTILGGAVGLFRPDGQPLPNAPAFSLTDPDSFERARLQQTPAISDLLRQEPDGSFAILVTVPVLRAGEVVYLLSLRLPAHRLLEWLQQAQLPQGWVGLLLDSARRTVARTARNAESQGQIAPPLPPQAEEAEAGLWWVRSRTGEQVMMASTLFPQLGWRVGVLVPPGIAMAPLRLSVILLFLGAVLLVCLAIAFATLGARRIAQPVQNLARAAKRLGRGEQVQLAPTAIREISDVGAALTEASTILRQREKELAESEARLARALEAGRIGTWEWEVETDRLTGSRGREVLYGRPADTIAKYSTLEEVVHPDDRLALRASREAAFDPSGPGYYDIQFRVVWPDGTIRWLRRQGAVVERAPDGRPIRLSGVVMDITPAQAAAERERQLANEVDHRARNVLTVVQSVLHMSHADDPARFAEAVKGRVTALARAHTLLANGQWLGTEIHSLARDVMGTYYDSGRLMLRGPELVIAPHAVQPFALLLHELATNAAQHGALSSPEGMVRLCWTERQESLLFFWRERDGPPVRQPDRLGFGLKVVENTARRQLGGKAEFRWEPQGFVCRLHFGAARLLRRGDLSPTFLTVPEPRPAARP